MFNSELYQISEESFKSINHEDLQKRNQKIEGEILEIIKAFSYTIDENGIAKIRISSKEKPYEYDIFNNMISSGRLKYFEEEYSLYFLGNEYVEVYSDVYNVITFIWNSLEYNIRNMSQAKEDNKKIML